MAYLDLKDIPNEELIKATAPRLENNSPLYHFMNSLDNKPVVSQEVNWPQGEARPVEDPDKVPDVQLIFQEELKPIDIDELSEHGQELLDAMAELFNKKVCRL